MRDALGPAAAAADDPAAPRANEETLGEALESTLVNDGDCGMLKQQRSRVECKTMNNEISSSD